MKPSHKTVALWIVLILLFASLFKIFDPGNHHRKELKFSDFIASVKAGDVKEVTFKADNLITGEYKDPVKSGQKFFEKFSKS